MNNSIPIPKFINELKYQEDLARRYKYYKLPAEVSEVVHYRFERNLPVNLWKHMELKTWNGTLFANGYERIVIGDYGAFIEISEDQIIKGSLKVAEGQEYRFEDQYKNCKYYWLTVSDGSNIKIYLQRNTVNYADYRVGFYYVSVYEVETVPKEMLS